MNKKKILLISIIAAVVLTGVMLLLIFLPKGGNEADKATADEGVKLELETDSEGMHQAVIGKNKDGKIETEGGGTLMEYVPADISRIHVENEKGTLDVLSNTPEGEATVYTLEGLEDFDLQSGVPDLIASSCASLSFDTVAGMDSEGSSVYGFDNPRAIVTVEYNDQTKAVITVGNEAPQSAGTYIKFGDGDEVYVIENETAAPFLYGVTDFISLEINDSADSVDNNILSRIDISVSGEDITLEPYSGSNLHASYVMTSPENRTANESESSKITGGIRGLYALSVAMVNPSDAQLSKLGLSSPHASISAEYPDASISLLASAPDNQGVVNLMEDGGRVVYTIEAEKVPWVSTSYKALVGEYVVYPKLTSLSGMTVNNSAEKHAFEISSRESVTTDEDGEESTATITTVYLDGREIEPEQFSPYFDEVSMIALADSDEEEPDGRPVLTVVYDYSDGESDTAEFYESSGSRYIAVLNGTVAGHATKADVTRAINDLAAAAE